MPTQTFYVPKGDREVTEEFVKITSKKNLNYSNVLMNFIKEYNEQHTCTTCDNEGTIQVLENCGKPASDCCGGCFAKKDCPDCNS